MVHTPNEYYKNNVFSIKNIHNPDEILFFRDKLHPEPMECGKNRHQRQESYPPKKTPYPLPREKLIPKRLEYSKLEGKITLAEQCGELLIYSISAFG
jgi:hypothetical protein